MPLPDFNIKYFSRNEKKRCSTGKLVELYEGACVALRPSMYEMYIWSSTRCTSGIV